jgi:hypothetical protein
MNAPAAAFSRWATVLVLVLVAAACTSTPQATREDDARAKEFHTHPSASTIYVYRSPFNHYDADSVLYIDGRLVGSTLPGAYFRIDTVPARHVLHGTGVDIGHFAIETRPGEIYFVELEVLAGHSNFRLVPERIGQREVRACCALLENWAPGQRPLLR